MCGLRYKYRDISPVANVWAQYGLGEYRPTINSRRIQQQRHWSGLLQMFNISTITTAKLVVIRILSLDLFWLFKLGCPLKSLANLKSTYALPGASCSLLPSILSLSPALIPFYHPILSLHSLNTSNASPHTSYPWNPSSSFFHEYQGIFIRLLLWIVRNMGCKSFCSPTSIQVFYHWN